MTNLCNPDATLLRVLRAEPVEYTPVWIMRQAGRYLPEYRALREEEPDFLKRCKNPEMACEITLQPINRFDLDAAIIFSDILTIPDAMGVGLHFEPNFGPVIERPVRSMRDVRTLKHVDVEKDLGYVADAVALTRQELSYEVPLIGFSGSPWTIATYMVEGGSTKSFSKIKKMAFADPNALHALLQILAKTVASYLLAQIKAGVQVVQIFDTWGGVLQTREYQAFSLQYMQYIVRQLKTTNESKHIPIIVFTKQGGQWLEMIADIGCDAIGLDWSTDLSAAKRQIGNRVALQGNMEPAVLYGSEEFIEQEVKSILTQYGSGFGHIFNLGHGIFPDINPDHVAACVNAVHEHSREYHLVTQKN